MINAYISQDTIVSASSDAFTLQEKSSFGEKKGNKIQYAAIEALYLSEEGKMQLQIGKKVLNSLEVLKKIKKWDKKSETKLAVYQDLRKRGYIIKTALKFGAEFRVYDKGIKPGQDHARWILYTAKEHELLKWHDFAAKNRVAHATKKNLLLAIVDDEGDVSYYEVSWLRP